jgi:chromate transporter
MSSRRPVSGAVSGPHPDPASGPSPPPLTPPSPAALRPTIAELFLAFAAISLSGFGGVLAWARRIMVEQRRWFTAEQFNEAFALCAILPGGNMVNFAVIFGARMRGPLGSLAALAGLLGPPMVLIMVVGALYAHYGDLPALRRMLTGVAAAAAGLMLATLTKMARPLFTNRLKQSFKNPGVIPPLIALATFVAIGVLHWPLPLVLLVIVPVSIGAAFLNTRMAR